MLTYSSLLRGSSVGLFVAVLAIVVPPATIGGAIGDTSPAAGSTLAETPRVDSALSQVRRADHNGLYLGQSAHVAGRDPVASALPTTLRLPAAASSYSSGPGLQVQPAPPPYAHLSWLSAAISAHRLPKLPGGNFRLSGNGSGETGGASSAWDSGSYLGGYESTFVSCVRTHFCMAIVGDNEVYKYNNQSWSPAPNVPTSAEVGGPSCATSTFCVVLDDDDSVYIWNGFKWRHESPISDTDNVGEVSCTSPTFCMAVGDNKAYRFNGNSWSESTALSGGGIFSVSCVSRHFCVAVGGVLAYVYRGSGWDNGDAVSPCCLTNVSCASSTFCMATTDDLAVHFNGTTWAHPENVVGETGGITSLSCTTPQFCMATGVDNVYRYSGGTWWDPVTAPWYGRNIVGVWVSCGSSTFSRLARGFHVPLPKHGTSSRHLDNAPNRVTASGSVPERAKRRHSVERQPRGNTLLDIRPKL